MCYHVQIDPILHVYARKYEYEKHDMIGSMHLSFLFVHVYIAFYTPIMLCSGTYRSSCCILHFFLVNYMHIKCFFFLSW